MAWCEREGIDFVFGLAQNPRLKKQIEEQMAQAEQQYAQTQAPARLFTEFFYSTKDTWSRERRVIAKAEHLDKGANPRFIVTSLSQEQMAAQELYEKVYCARGDCPENASRSSSWICLRIAPARELNVLFNNRVAVDSFNDTDETRAGTGRLRRTATTVRGLSASATGTRASTATSSATRLCG